MEKPTAQTVAYYDAAVPEDPRARKGQMFGHPCAFVNGNMFFGTFHQTVVARVGPERAAALAKGKLRLFEPMPGRVWKEYVQVDAGSMPRAKLAALATEALDWTDKLPGKGTKAKAAAKAKPKPKATAPAKPTPKAKTKR